MHRYFSLCIVLDMCRDIHIAIDSFSTFSPLLLQHYFSMFLHKSETYSLMEQLTNIAMKR